MLGIFDLKEGKIYQITSHKFMSIRFAEIPVQPFYLLEIVSVRSSYVDVSIIIKDRIVKTDFGNQCRFKEIV